MVILIRILIFPTNFPDIDWDFLHGKCCMVISSFNWVLWFNILSLTYSRLSQLQHTTRESSGSSPSNSDINLKFWMLASYMMPLCIQIQFYLPLITFAITFVSHGCLLMKLLNIVMSEFVPVIKIDPKQCPKWFTPESNHQIKINVYVNSLRHRKKTIL